MIKPEDVNLDCFMSANDLIPFADDESLPPQVRDYAVEKMMAMLCRKYDRINDALAHEAVCEKIYKEIEAPWMW